MGGCSVKGGGRSQVEPPKAPPTAVEPPKSPPKAPPTAVEPPKAPPKAVMEPPKVVEETKKLPYNYESIMKEADTRVDQASMANLYDHLQKGVFLNQKKKKYWIEGKQNYNCFMWFARCLSITWGSDQRYWSWATLNESSDGDVEVARLLNVCWLEIHGNLETSNLSPETGYEVVFVVKLEDDAYGWEVPVNLRLTCEDGEVQQHKVSLKDKPRGEWIELQVGNFTMVQGKGGEIEASLYESEGGNWKKGLIVKGVVIRPKH